MKWDEGAPQLTGGLCHVNRRAGPRGGSSSRDGPCVAVTFIIGGQAHRTRPCELESTCRHPNWRASRGSRGHDCTPGEREAMSGDASAGPVLGSAMGAGTLLLSPCPAGMAPTDGAGGWGKNLRGRRQQVEGQKERPSQSQGAREMQGPGAADTLPVPSQRRPLGCLTPTGTL